MCVCVCACIITGEVLAEIPFDRLRFRCGQTKRKDNNNLNLYISHWQLPGTKQLKNKKKS